MRRLAGIRRPGLVAAVGLCCTAAVGSCPASSPRAEVPAIAEPFHVIAHRGASAYAPENTLPAFEQARRLGASVVELDVQLSRDGVVVLFHDRTLDEKTDLSGAVSDHDAETLLRADIGSWFDARHPDAETRYAGTRLTTLDAVFRTFGSAFHYHVELKSPAEALPARVLEVVRAHALLPRVTISSFHIELLERTRTLEPQVAIAWLVETPDAAESGSGPEARRQLVDGAASRGFGMIAFPTAELDEELVAHAHGQGLLIRAWRVKQPEDVEHVIRVGANGLTVDWPDRVLRRLDEIRAGQAALPRP